jgi:hypothetical protein
LLFDDLFLAADGHDPETFSGTLHANQREGFA